jgi:hypothetical protein
VGSIIFVHGLRGHPRATWSYLRSTSTTGRNEDTDARINEHKNIKSFFKLKKSKKEKNNQGQTSTSIPTDIFWPEEYLVPDLPQARIWTYGYNVDVIGGLFQANNKNSVSQHGRDLVVQLNREIDNEVYYSLYTLSEPDIHMYRIRLYSWYIALVGSLSKM